MNPTANNGLSLRDSDFVSGVEGGGQQLNFREIHSGAERAHSKTLARMFDDPLSAGYRDSSAVRVIAK
jgi:hypothetical protein